VKADLQHHFKRVVYKTTILLKIFQVRKVLPNFFTKNENVSFHELENYYVACKVSQQIVFVKFRLEG